MEDRINKYNDNTSVILQDSEDIKGIFLHLGNISNIFLIGTAENAVDTGPGSGLVPSGIKPLPDAKMARFSKPHSNTK